MTLALWLELAGYVTWVVLAVGLVSYLKGRGEL